MADTATARFREAIEVARAGWIFAHDDKQYKRWARSNARPADREPGLTGHALEVAILGIRALHPDIVTVRA